MQGVMYFVLAAEKFLKDVPDRNQWNVQVTFIVIDKYNLVYPFQVSQESMVQWRKDFKQVLDVASWHYENKNYSLPYDLAVGNIKL
jgi:hypothetical protein